eukprot:6175100-Pleurochrysis_carterae.AAC.2
MRSDRFTNPAATRGGRASDGKRQPKLLESSCALALPSSAKGVQVTCTLGGGGGRVEAVAIEPEHVTGLEGWREHARHVGCRAQVEAHETADTHTARRLHAVGREDAHRKKEVAAAGERHRRGKVRCRHGGKGAADALRGRGVLVHGAWASDAVSIADVHDGQCTVGRSTETCTPWVTGIIHRISNPYSCLRHARFTMFV